MTRLRVWEAQEFRDWSDYLEKRDELAWDAVHPQIYSLADAPPAEITDIEDAADTFAEFFYNERGGNECTWPVDFIVHDRSTDTYHLVAVDIDWDPVFTSSKARELADPDLRVSVGDLLYADLGNGNYVRFKVDGWRDGGRRVSGLTEDKRPIEVDLYCLSRTLKNTTDTATNDDKEKQSHG